ncbi:MAG: alanyl-tRNA editing protein [Candidatus Aenigmarchaeota archaeon]|nr:alanyl-tRNA editing protein [Candidatus Aenigmarchaeota archaeon]
MTEALYMKDSYLKEFEAKVVEMNGDQVILDRTAFYPQGGGQPNDLGTLESGGKSFNVINVTKSSGTIFHHVAPGGLSVGDSVVGKIDWTRRYRLMRMHTAAHIIDAVLYKEAGALCTGNQLGVDKSRIDFSLDVIDREKMQHFIDMSNEEAGKCIGVKIYFMKREEALKIPGIVKLAAAMPPSVDNLRIVEIPDIDMQADGGTQVANTKEIGKIELLSMENKGKNNRRIYYALNGQKEKPPF